MKTIEQRLNEVNISLIPQPECQVKDGEKVISTLEGLVLKFYGLYLMASKRYFAEIERHNRKFKQYADQVKDNGFDSLSDSVKVDVERSRLKISTILQESEMLSGAFNSLMRLSLPKEYRDSYLEIRHGFKVVPVEMKVKPVATLIIQPTQQAGIVKFPRGKEPGEDEVSKASPAESVPRGTLFYIFY